VDHGEELRHRILELLMPGGEPVGEPSHRRSDFRVVQGSLDAAEVYFDRFRDLGEPMNAPNYPGELIALGGENRVGLRQRSKSGEPTMDVWVQYIPEIRKITFV
jgi:hypothetical protein